MKLRNSFNGDARFEGDRALPMASIPRTRDPQCASHRHARYATLMTLLRSAQLQRRDGQFGTTKILAGICWSRFP